MQFLSPSAALVALAAVPLLLLLYFLKLRRRALRIASTLLWRRATEDLQANVPFQRLRASLLLFLQLAAVLLLILALARPVLTTASGPVRRVIVLIDTSASMSARDAPGRTRLDAARDSARDIIDRMGRRGEPGELMVVTFAATAQVACSFESNRQILRDIVDTLEPTDEEADLAAALELAGAFARRDETTELPQVVVISDGGVAPPAGSEGFRLRAGDFRFIGVGPQDPNDVDNFGIAALSARRDHRDPARLLVFCRVVNAGPDARQVALTLRADGEPVSVRTLALPGAADLGPGEASCTLELELPGEAIVTVSLGRADDLTADDTAALVVPPPAQPRIALVHPLARPDPFLVSLIEATEPTRLLMIPADQSPGPDLSDRATELDLIIYDRVAAPRLPSVASLSFGAAPVPVVLQPPATPGGRRLVSWDRHHPLLRHVSLDTLVYAGAGALALPNGAEALALGPEGPVIGVLQTAGARHVVVGFALTQSNWPVDVSIAVFLQNALDYLTLAGATAAEPLRAGAPVSVRPLAGTDVIRIDGPISAELESTAGAPLTLPPLRRVGLYTIEGVEPRDRRLAVSVLSDIESDIRPRRTLVVNAVRQEAGGVRDAVPLELWPYLAAAAIGLLVLEWLAYCLRVRR
jgi:hypothetical protein